MPQLTGADLKRIVALLPDDAVVVVGNEVVNGVRIDTGKIGDGYYNPIFRVAPKGKVKALRFTKRTELSDGSIDHETVI